MIHLTSFLDASEKRKESFSRKRDSNLTAENDFRGKDFLSVKLQSIKAAKVSLTTTTIMSQCGFMSHHLLSKSLFVSFAPRLQVNSKTKFSFSRKRMFAVRKQDSES